MFSEISDVLHWFLRTFRWQDAVDILIVAYVLYELFKLFKGTRALQMIIGLTILVMASFIFQWAKFYTISWLLNNLWAYLALSVIILFQPEIRRTLAHMGQSPVFSSMNLESEAKTIDELVKGSVTMASRKIGALILLEREHSIEGLIEMGTPIDSKLSKEILLSIFLPYSPIHDGAVIIQKDRIKAAGCFLPLTLNLNLSKELGTRHRAAMGITEETDAVVIVVSEETGTISVVIGGKITRDLDAQALRRVLTNVMRPVKKKTRKWF
ncbi:MAG: TIGR00159 family protein [Nitrospirae bacterium CG_4_9_14_3_um_filter_53_35]|nr:MAG: TIGR00159 family protein [Nitrospirae bacterium CG2_30_53_67]PIS36319.1 MAG: TIGR00159 family protein [Nitrospirae bacterium CG08_land_8_20_14_0_20_52_24]PIV84902.1 MAG: TIGR00159 family protein [Nitrospirae bacterium CG17_big_fil_post_rev_8_21_14_2_50_50_9]PIW84195.1 MAG: TIGR00159 family protein [Nitrospirae bacterium CG_4_8_14_3_um_filter_50_41]PIX86482.1 MAG: TIGR00159 family protein [Nitrospirae bacterium CG_4_10_14_3_um_filter_53_41]PJA73008.1 MAG: TIGR00159 family protein [Nitro